MGISDGNHGDGVQFPSEGGRRSTQQTARAILSAAVRSTDAETAERFERIDNWRKNYVHAARELVELGARSAKNAGRIASDGLDALRARFIFERDGRTLPLTDVFSLEPVVHLDTEIVRGQAAPLNELTIPYRGELLRGDALKRQLDEWTVNQIIEPSCAQAVRMVIDDPGRLDLSGRTFAVLGAASEMGPFPWLCRWGANVRAVDVPDPDLWNRVVDTAKQGSGRVAIPVRGAPSEDIAARAGVDLIAELPEARAWLMESEEPFTLGDYAYSDGSLFARLAAATDTLAEDLLDGRQANGYAYLASPTDVFAVTPDIVAGARANRKGVGRRVLGAITAKKLYSPSYTRTAQSEDGTDWGIYDCLIPQQGANYSLAKSLQRWRAVATHEDGILVSANVAPATRTRSVVKNKVLAAAYAGAGPFGVEVFQPATSSALMAALLVHDLTEAGSSTGNPHPFSLFVSSAAHGGLWRLPYEPRTVLPLAVLLGYTTHRSR